jgi:hypothetical protein
VLIAFDLAGVKKSLSYIRTEGYLIMNAKHLEKFTPEMHEEVA